MPADAVLAATSLARCASFCCASRLARYSKNAREAAALLGRFCAATSPAPGCSNSASNAPRGSSAIAAIELAAGPRPNRCRASAASSCGFVVMVASELSGLLRCACFGAAPDGCSHGAILARPGSTGRHATVKANYLTDEGLIRFGRCRARVVPGARGPVMLISRRLVSAVAIDVQIEHGLFASARSVRH